MELIDRLREVMKKEFGIETDIFQDEIKVYVKAENGAVRVFLPEEW
jgi:hypothetical protein